MNLDRSLPFTHGRRPDKEKLSRLVATTKTQIRPEVSSIDCTREKCLGLRSQQGILTKEASSTNSATRRTAHIHTQQHSSTMYAG